MLPRVICGQQLTATSYDLENMRDDNGKITRESVANWLTCHSGDFSEVLDFSASLEDGAESIDIPWATEEGELAYADATCDYVE